MSTRRKQLHNAKVKASAHPPSCKQHATPRHATQLFYERSTGALKKVHKSSTARRQPTCNTDMIANEATSRPYSTLLLACDLFTLTKEVSSHVKFLFLSRSLFLSVSVSSLLLSFFFLFLSLSRSLSLSLLRPFPIQTRWFCVATGAFVSLVLFLSRSLSLSFSSLFHLFFKQRYLSRKGFVNLRVSNNKHLG